MSLPRLTAWLRLGAALLATAGALALTACGGGSGAPNNPYAPGPAIPGPLTVVPLEAVAFAGTPLILSISGGTPPYQAFSSNPAALPVPQNVTGNTLALLANNVDAAQPANVTIRDAGGQTALSEIIVRPAVLLPASLTIVPNAAPCDGGDVCSGQTSVASVRVVRGCLDSMGMSTSMLAFLVTMPIIIIMRFTTGWLIEWRVTASAVFQSVPGLPRNITYVVSRTQVPQLTLSSVTVPLSAPGEEYLPRLNQLDLKFGKTFRYRGRSIQPQLGIFNVTNEGTVLAQNNSFGPTLGRVQSILDGRVVRLSLQIDF